jgi:NADPH:quinone reductase-like Zn-dependent oxidoreductase
VPGPDEVLVRVLAASINPSDVKNVQGRFEQTTLPRTPGRDLAGIVVEGDKGMAGQEIWATGGDVGFTRDGSHAEFVGLARRSVHQKPAALSMSEAAAVGTNYITAYIGLVEKARVKAGETVLVTGVGGGVGSSVAKIAKSRGARVIGVDRQAPEPDAARALGLSLGLGSAPDDIRGRVKEFTHGRGVDVVFDCVGGPLFEVVLDTLAEFGRQINITAVGERRVAFDLMSFYRRQLTLFGVNTSLSDAVASGKILERLRPSFEKGELTAPSIAEECSLDDAVEAYVRVDTGAARGKVVITFGN